MSPLTTLTIFTLLAHLVSSHPTSSATVLQRVVTKESKAGIAGGLAPAQFAASNKITWYIIMACLAIYVYGTQVLVRYYTWSPDASGLAASTDLEFVPMLWGEKHAANWNQTIGDIISKNNVNSVLGMNEPELPGQSNLNPQQGADMWRAYLEPLRSSNVRLGSPATASGPAGVNWTQDFFTVCGGGCNPDFMAMHWYGVNASQFITFVEQLHDKYQKPIWVTEWACQNFVDQNSQCSKDDIALFLNKTQDFLDSTDYVERYAWFGVPGIINPDNALVTQDGQLTPLGEQYVGKTPPPIDGSGSADGPPSGGTGGDGPSISGSPRITVSVAPHSLLSLIVLACLTAL
jgi:hypothetical protein